MNWFKKRGEQLDLFSDATEGRSLLVVGIILSVGGMLAACSLALKIPPLGKEYSIRIQQCDLSTTSDQTRNPLAQGAEDEKSDCTPSKPLK